MGDIVDKLIGKIQGWGEDLILMLPNLGGALAVLILFWILSRYIGKGVHSLFARVSSHEALNELVTTITRVIVKVAGILVALQILNLDKAATTFIAGAGIIGLAIGFAFQDLTANFIAGIVMAMNRPFKVGDLVETNDYLGTVEIVEMRSTRLRLLQGPVVRIPNRKIFEECLVNFNHCSKRRIDLVVGVSYGDDLKKAKAAATDAVANLVGVEEEPRLFFQEFGDSSIDFVIQFWVPFQKQSDYLEAQSEAIVAIKHAFDACDITIPFPIRTLDFGIVGGEKLSQQLRA
jgi:small conductance mechanosensitive channel